MEQPPVHEAQESDLEVLLVRLRTFWDAHGTKVLIAITLTAVAITAKRWIDAKAAQAKQQAWHDLAYASSPDSYLSVAQEHEEPSINALAHLRAADLLLLSVTRPSEPQDDPANEQKNLDEATIRYSKVTDNADNHPLFRINAHLGLAAVAETRGKWADAETQYNHVIELAESHYKNLSQYADARLKLLPRLKTPVVFAPDPPAAPASTTPTDEADTPVSDTTDGLTPDPTAAPTESTP